MKLPNIGIGITGLAGHGKDTLARELRNRLLIVETIRCRFGGPVYDELAKLTGGKCVTIEENKRHSLLMRKLLQTIATYHRSNDEYYFVKAARKEVAKYEKDNRLFIFPDLRHHNEVAFIRSYFPISFIFRIEKFIEGHRVESLDTHSTELEQHQIQADYYIKNEFTLPLGESIDVEAAVMDIQGKIH